MNTEHENSEQKTPNYYPENETFFQRNKNLLKGFLISFLILALMIPTFFISTLIDERKERNQEVKKEIANQWSKAQTIAGPVLAVPFYEAGLKKYAYFMPSTLNINGKLLPEIKRRSIFSVPVYNSNIELSGTFKEIDCKPLGIASDKLLWNETKLIIGITDFKGLQEETKINWDNTLLTMSVGDNLGVNAQNYLSNREEINESAQALQVPIILDGSENIKTHTFNLKLQLRGSEQLFFTPVGTSTKVSLNANWKDRDFKGNYLPDSHSLTDTGFTANWNVYRSMLPQQKYTLNEIGRTTFGVNLIQPLDNYAKTTRTIKYAILVIMLTFVVYFFIEVFQKKQVHAVQYVLIGFALCIFYTLVLSISEYTSFQNAYVISALATILLIALYTKSTFNSNKTALIFGGFLAMLYSFIFVLIQLEDGALLVGSIGLFIILAAIMFFTRKLNWHK